MEGVDLRMPLLVALARVASGKLRPRCLDVVLRDAAEMRRLELFGHLTELLPTLVDVGGQETLAELCVALEEVRPMWP